MKKFLVVVGTMVGFSLAEVILDSVLGITFPSTGAMIAHSLLLMTNGAALFIVLRANIE